MAPPISDGARNGLDDISSSPMRNIMSHGYETPDMQPQRFFSMEDDSEDEHDVVTNLSGPQASTPPSTHPEIPEIDIKGSPADSAISPSSSLPTALPSYRNSDGDEGDAWTEDDWVSPRLARGQTSPCTSANGLNSKQQEVADAVLSDLQLDLQSQVERAVNQMSSWISDEITFARKSLEEDKRKVRESCATEHAGLQHFNDALVARMDQLQASLEAQSQTMKKFEEDTSTGPPRPRAVTAPQALRTMVDPETSTNVKEAQKLAEERKWRLTTEKLEELQRGLDSHVERIEALDEQCTNLVERTTLQDAKIAGSTSTVQGIQSHINAAKFAAEERGSCLERIDKLGEMATDLASKVMSHDAILEASGGQIYIIEGRFNSQVQDIVQMNEDIANKFMALDGQWTNLWDKATSQDAKIAGNTEIVQGMQAEIASAKLQSQENMGSCFQKIEKLGSSLERLDKLGETSSDLAARVAAHGTKIYMMQERFDNEAQDVTNRLLVHNSDINDCATQIYNLEERLSNNDNSLSAARISSLEDKLSKDASELSKANVARDSSIEVSFRQVCHLEELFGRASKELSEKIAGHDIGMKDSTRQIHDLRDRLGNEAKEFAEQGEVHTANFKIASSRMQDLEEGLRKQTMELTEKLAMHAVDIRTKLATHGCRSEDMAQRVAAQDASLSHNNAQIENLELVSSCLKTDLQEQKRSLAEANVQLTTHEGDIHEVRNIFNGVRSQLARHESDSQVVKTRLLEREAQSQCNADAAQAIKSQLNLAQKEQLAEMQVVHGKLEKHAAKLISLPIHFKAQLSSQEDGLAKSLDDLRFELLHTNTVLSQQLTLKANLSEVDETRDRLAKSLDSLRFDLLHTKTELSQQLTLKADLSEVEETRDRIQVWVDEACIALRTMVTDMAMSLEEATSSSQKHSESIRKQQVWMKDTCAWLESSQECERGMSHIVYRIIENDYPELISLFEETVTGASR